MPERAGVRAGDPDAFARLFDQNARAVYNHAFRLTGDWSTAEEAMALTFLEAWRLRRRVDPEGGSLRPWLLGIATNTVRNFTRAARRYAAAIARLPAPEPAADFAGEVADRLYDAERVRDLLALVNRLKRTEREVFALCVWSGLDYAETAEALGIPVGTVKSRLSRARARLREKAASTHPEHRQPEPPPVGGQVMVSRENAARPSSDQRPGIQYGANR